MADPLMPTRVIQRACTIYGMDRNTLLSPTRERPYAHARFAIAYVFRSLGLTLVQTSRLLGRTDHTTAVNAVRKAEILCQYEPGYPEIIAELFDAAQPGASRVFFIPYLQAEAA